MSLLLSFSMNIVCIPIFLQTPTYNGRESKTTRFVTPDYETLCNGKPRMIVGVVWSPLRDYSRQSPNGVRYIRFRFEVLCRGTD